MFDFFDNRDKYRLFSSNLSFFLLLLVKTRILSRPIFFKLVYIFRSSSSKQGFRPVSYFSIFCPSFCSSSSKLGFCPVPYFCKLVLIFCSSSSKLGWILSVWCGVGQLCLWGTFAEWHRNQQHKKVFKTSHRRIGIKTETKWQRRSIKSPSSSLNQT